MQRSEKTCPACGGTHLKEIYHLSAIPVQSCILLDTREEALAFPRAELKLEFCHDCGFVFNSLFDLDLVDYASTTEESQHFSDTFSGFAKGLVEEIANTYDLSGKTTLEIGCGKGEFLKELVSRTGTTGLGVDPGFIPERLPDADAAKLSFQKEYFTPKTIGIHPDFVVCRHTLEHVPDVGSFMADISEVIDGTDVGIFFETPDVNRVLSEGAFWDIYYEHCSYFTLGSHARLFRKSGMDVTNLYLAYDSQYIIQYAEPAQGNPPLDAEDDLSKLRDLAETFPEQIAATRQYWTDFVKQRHADGKTVAIWGGGSKGVSFLTTNNVGEEVAHVVDINPHKQGKYLPGTGHRVIGPEGLKTAGVDTVIVMNPIYLTEIKNTLQQIDVEAEVVAV
ncbi:class I SAM-dependent methyltransferase [Poseidonocella sp. HB161398]|uniref:class I SAM-dependent methyltransferase n=1 Tax=Poseidonocella sp. HB161398 TaxID=2320855 RepID=UPI00110838CA|nr:class I SAM-dependent methyltransferase [Poseidonocella sp. HB161398]